MTTETPRTLQEVVERAPSVQELLYHNPTGARVYPVVPAEFTN
jgi:vanillate/3-O-methylgallate O-demethylase